MDMQDKYKKAFGIWFSVVILSLMAVSLIFTARNSRDAESSLSETESLVENTIESNIESNIDSVENSENVEKSEESIEKIITESEDAESESNRDMSSETRPEVIIKDYKQEKAVLINVYNKLVEAYDNPDNFVFVGVGIGDDELGFDIGIKPDMYKTYFCKKSRDKFTPDIYLAICAEEGRAEDVKKQLYKYKDKLTVEFESLPSDIERIQSADIVQHGDYIYFILLGKVDKTASAELIREQQKLNNKKAVEIVLDDLNYENVPEDIKEDKGFQLIEDTVYQINIPEIKSKPQNINDESEENITPEESEQADLEEGSDTNIVETQDGMKENSLMSGNDTSSVEGS